MNINLKNQKIIYILPNFPESIKLKKFSKIIDINSIIDDTQDQLSQATNSLGNIYKLSQFISTRYSYIDKQENINYYIDYIDFISLNEIDIIENQFDNPITSNLSKTISSQIQKDVIQNKIKLCDKYNLVYNIKKYLAYLLYISQNNYLNIDSSININNSVQSIQSIKYGVILDFSKIQQNFSDKIYQYYQDIYQFILKFLYHKLSSQEIKDYITYTSEILFKIKTKTNNKITVYNYFDNQDKSIYQLKIKDVDNLNLRNWKYKSLNIYDNLINRIYQILYKYQHTNTITHTNTFNIDNRDYMYSVNQNVLDQELRKLGFEQNAYKTNLNNQLLVYTGQYSPNENLPLIDFNIRIYFSYIYDNILYINNFDIIESNPQNYILIDIPKLV